MLVRRGVLPIADPGQWAFYRPFGEEHSCWSDRLTSIPMEMLARAMGARLPARAQRCLPVLSLPHSIAHQPKYISWPPSCTFCAGTGEQRWTVCWETAGFQVHSGAPAKFTFVAPCSILVRPLCRWRRASNLSRAICFRAAFTCSPVTRFQSFVAGARSCVR